MGWQRVGHDLLTKQQEKNSFIALPGKGSCPKGALYYISWMLLFCLWILSFLSLATVRICPLEFGMFMEAEAYLPQTRYREHRKAFTPRSPTRSYSVSFLVDQFFLHIALKVISLNISIACFTDISDLTYMCQIFIGWLLTPHLLS